MREDSASPRSQLKEWMPRLADQLATFQDLLGVRRRYGRHMRQSQALLDAVQRLQGDRGGEGLARALCETALDVSGARGAVLVRWDGDADVGELTFATEGTGLTLPPRSTARAWWPRRAAPASCWCWRTPASPHQGSRSMAPNA